MDILANDLSDHHQVNISQIFEDFAKLQTSINIENIDIASAQETIQRINTMKDLKQFDPTAIHFEKLSELLTVTAIFHGNTIQLRTERIL
jgi:hypothetical protein